VLNEKVSGMESDIRTFAPAAVTVANVGGDVSEIKSEMHAQNDRLTRHVGGIYEAVNKLRSDMNGNFGKQNERLGVLERAKSYGEGARAALSWVQPLGVALVAGVVVALATHFLA
jgi:hypothetical protein